MLEKYELRLLLLLTVLNVLFQVIYVYLVKSRNPLEILVLFLIDVIIFTMWLYELTEPTVSKPHASDYVSFGTTVNDAIYGRHYNYDLMVDTHKKFEREKQTL